MKRWGLFVISAVVLILVGAATIWHSRSGGPGDMIQEATPQAILKHIRELDAPLVLVNFWASWCEPCKVEFPHILQVREEFAGRGLKVVLVSIDNPADLNAAKVFLTSQKVDFPTFYKGAQTMSFVTEIYPKWSGAVPATLLFGPGGVLLEAWEGDTSLEEFQTKVQQHLGDQ